MSKATLAKIQDTFGIAAGRIAGADSALRQSWEQCLADLADSLSEARRIEEEESLAE